MGISHKSKFYLNLVLEIIISPVAYSKNFFKWHFGNKNKQNKFSKVRTSVLNDKLAVSIHEWGGYEGKRVKKIKNIEEFECGLDYQLERFKNYKGKYTLDLNVTLSDSHLFKKEINDVNVIEVSNLGMDFSGYEAFYEKIKNEDNQYIILTNSSVNKYQADFIDDYIDFFKENRTIGMLGASFNSKMYQSLIRNNFNPHLQSFFLLTTTDVLKEVILFNKTFPGKGIDHKLALIKNGEIRLSRIVMELGYKLSCILDNGEPFLFDINDFKDNGKSSWQSFFGDYRLKTLKPNAINPINRNTQK